MVTIVKGQWSVVTPVVTIAKGQWSHLWLQSLFSGVEHICACSMKNDVKVCRTFKIDIHDFLVSPILYSRTYNIKTGALYHGRL